jgi:hypothetical protein
LQDFKDKFKKFKNDLNVNYKKAYDYFKSSGLFSVSVLAGGGKYDDNSNSNSKTPISQKETPTIRKQNKSNTLNKEGIFTNKKKLEILNDLLFNIDGVMLEYKDIDLEIGYEERKFYPSFEIDDDM